MNKLYILLVIIIVGLIVWLVTDLMENKVEADRILNISAPVTGTDGAPMVFAPAKTPRSSWPAFFGPKIAEELVVEKMPSAPNFILTGIIIEPKVSKAFILLPSGNEEKVCRVGDKIDGWEIVQIVPDEVKLVNTAGEVFMLRFPKTWVKPDMPGAPHTTVVTSLIKDVLQNNNIELPAGISPELLNSLLKGGEPSAVVNEQLRAVVDLLPPAYVRDMITKLTDLGKEDIPEDDTKLGTFASDLFKVVSGETPKTATDAPLEEITFSTTVNPNNSPLAPKNQFKPSDKRLYACFANKGTLLKQPKVVTRWTNRTSGQIEYLSSKLINQDAEYNYIWVEKKDGWPMGEYEVELLRTQTMEKIASGFFTISQ